MFNAIIDISLRQRLLVLAVALLLIVYGTLTLKQMPVDVFPDLNKPTVTLMTEAAGMAPEEVEQLVTFPIESAMNGMPGVTRVRSVSGVGLSIVFVEFDWGSNIYLNRQQVAERLGLVREQLPQGIVPQMGPISSIMGEIMLIALQGAPERGAVPAPSGGGATVEARDATAVTGALSPASGSHPASGTPAPPSAVAPDSAKISPMQLREFADWVVRPRLLTVSGVSQVIAIGGEVKQYQVTPDVLKMEDVGITLEDVKNSLKNFAANTSGGFLEASAREYLIRHIGRTTRLEDLQDVVVGHNNRQPILLKQIAVVSFAAKQKRGDASFKTSPAVILSVQKQPSADTVKLTREIETALRDLAKGMPAGMSAPEILFKQADFIENSVKNVEDALRDGAIMVAAVLFLFLLNLRTTLISLTAIPVSILVTALVFRYLGLSINTMTLGGLAIAIGALVDDAIVGMENIFRRLRLNAAGANPKPAVPVIAAATKEVLSGIVYATVIIALVFVPLFSLSGIEGRLFAPLGIAFIISILASMLVSVTLTPVMCFYLLPQISSLITHHSSLGTHDYSPLVGKLKAWDTRLLEWSFGHAKLLLVVAALAVLLAAAAVPFFARSFLPAFNEGTFTLSLLLNPGTSLSESNRVGIMAERLIMQVPEVVKVGRRTGRAELDEHAEGVHSSEIDVDIKRSARDRETIMRDIRDRLAALPAVVGIGQPISHRLDHLLSGVRAQIALKIYGDDLDTLRGLAADLRERLARIPGLVDLQIEKQVLIPQQVVRLDYAKSASYGVAPAAVLDALQTLIGGEEVSQVVDGNRRFDVVMRVSEHDRTQHGLSDLLIETPGGRIPVSQIAQIEDTVGPNQISRDNGRRRIVLLANTDGRDMAEIIGKIRTEIAARPLPDGYFTGLEGQFQAQEEATTLITWLSLISLAMIFLVLYSRYRSTVLSLVIMGNIPLALVGSVIALWLSGQPLSVASLIGFITLAGISTRNGILKVSHYINLAAFEGEHFGKDMIIRGSLERLTPVLMTALVAAFALVPLLIAAGEPGKEILHPVAVVIFGGLVSSTILDTILTPVMFYRWGEKPLKRLLALHERHSF